MVAVTLFDDGSNVKCGVIENATKDFSSSKKQGFEKLQHISQSEQFNFFCEWRILVVHRFRWLHRTI